jgi:hypothetical protein
MSRREALSESLRPGRHPDPPRSHSTLFERPEAALGGSECVYCDALIRSVVTHLTGHVVLEDYPSGYEALLEAVQSFPAGGRRELSRRAGAGANGPAGARAEEPVGPFSTPSAHPSGKTVAADADGTARSAPRALARGSFEWPVSAQDRHQADEQTGGRDPEDRCQDEH